MKRLMIVFMLMTVSSFTATGEEKQEPQGSGAIPMMGMMQMMQECPMKVAGAEIAIADASSGIALTLTTKSGNVDELRRRAERMANMHAAPAEDSSAMAGKMIPGVAKYEAIPNGARLTLTPKDPARLTELRKQVRSHVENMKKEGGCSMMGKPVGGTKPEPAKAESEIDHNAHHPGEKP